MNETDFYCLLQVALCVFVCVCVCNGHFNSFNCFSLPLSLPLPLLIFCCACNSLASGRALWWKRQTDLDACVQLYAMLCLCVCACVCVSGRRVAAALVVVFSVAPNHILCPTAEMLATCRLPGPDLQSTLTIFATISSHSLTHTHTHQYTLTRMYMHVHTLSRRYACTYVYISVTLFAFFNIY